MTLVEATVSMSLILLTVVPIMSLLATSRTSVGEGRHFTLARMAAASQIERLRARAYTSEAVFGGLVTEINGASTFTVPGLPARTGGVPHGLITAVVDEADLDGMPDANTIELDLAVSAGVGLDIDASGTENNVGAAGNFRLIPVRVQVSWGAQQVSTVTMDTVIAPRTNFRRAN